MHSVLEYLDDLGFQMLASFAGLLTLYVARQVLLRLDQIETKLSTVRDDMVRVKTMLKINITE